MLHELNTYDAPYLKEMTNSPYLVGPDGYWLRDKETGKVLVWDAIDRKAKTYDAADIKDFALEGSFEIEGVQGKPAFQMLKDHVKQYTPEWASSVTEISAEKIRRITKEFVDAAKIGSTIDIDGVRLPYRPAATLCGRGVTGQMHSYQTILADHILAVLIGGLEVPGGHMGGSNMMDGVRKRWNPLPAFNRNPRHNGRRGRHEKYPSPGFPMAAHQLQRLGNTDSVHG